MSRVAVMVVDAARALGAILLAREFADVAHRGGRAQEGRDLGGQRLGGGLPDHPVPHRAPGQGLGGQERERGDGGEQRSFHALPFRRS